MQKDVVIIGAGPAGVAAAIQLKRADKSFCIFECHLVGGLLRQANWVENFLGFPKGISGNELSNHFVNHLECLDIKPIYETVKEIKWNGQEFEVESISSHVCAPYLIVASGTLACPIPVEFSPEAKNYIHSEIANLKDVEDSKIIIVGGGDAAFDYGLNLADRNHVFILYRSASCCLPLLYERAKAHPNIQIMKKAHIENVTSRNDGVTCHYNDSENKKQSMNAHHVLFAVGRYANFDFLRNNFTPTKLDQLQERKRLYLVGDVKNGKFRQAAISAGEGLKTAMEIIEDMRH